MQSHGRSLRGLPAALCFLLTRRPLPCGRGMAARSRQPPPQHPLDLWGTVMAPCCALRTENLSCPTPGGCPRVPHLQLPAEPHSPCHSQRLPVFPHRSVRFSPSPVLSPCRPLAMAALPQAPRAAPATPSVASECPRSSACGCQESHSHEFLTHAC